MVTWAQLGLHSKPCGLLNVNGYYDPLLVFLDAIVDRGLLSANNRALFLTDSDPGTLIHRMTDHRPAVTTKWL